MGPRPNAAEVRAFSVAGPPEQWFMPGTRNRRAKASALPLWLACRRSIQWAVSMGENTPSATPWKTIILAPRFFRVLRSVSLGGVMYDQGDSVYCAVVANILG